MRRPATAPALLALALSLALGACAPLQTTPVPEGQANAAQAWEQRRSQLEAYEGFELQGRLAVKGGGLSGALRWQQAGSRFRLRLAGPFGAGALSLEGDDALVAIKSKDLDLVTAEPEAVLASRTGWRLPLAALRWWVLGLPAPEAPASLQLDGQGRPLGFSQLGWQLRYSDWRPGSPSLPGRIEAQQEAWQALLLIENLSLGAAPALSAP
jgi:outer membrane lipoprotein LolB